jgi:hypothetical protein
MHDRSSVFSGYREKVVVLSVLESGQTGFLAPGPRRKLQCGRGGGVGVLLATAHERGLFETAD